MPEELWYLSKLQNPFSVKYELMLLENYLLKWGRLVFACNLYGEVWPSDAFQFMKLFLSLYLWLFLTIMIACSLEFLLLCVCVWGSLFIHLFFGWRLGERVIHWLDGTSFALWFIHPTFACYFSVFYNCTIVGLLFCFLRYFYDIPCPRFNFRETGFQIVRAHEKEHSCCENSEKYT